jgi:hypothetical protein
MGGNNIEAEITEGHQNMICSWCGVAVLEGWPLSGGGLISRRGGPLLYARAAWRQRR